MEKRLCMPIKSLPACKTIDENYRRTKQINFNTEQPGSSSTEQKNRECFTKNPLADYELGLTLDTAAESETIIYRKQK
jgi:excinuclease ABC subunit B